MVYVMTMILSSSLPDSIEDFLSKPVSLCIGVLCTCGTGCFHVCHKQGGDDLGTFVRAGVVLH